MIHFVEIDYTKLQQINILPFDVFNVKGNRLASKGTPVKQQALVAKRIYLRKELQDEFQEYVIPLFQIEPLPAALTEPLTNYQNTNSITREELDKAQEMYSHLVTGIKNILEQETTSETLHYARKLSDEIFSLVSTMHKITNYIDKLRHVDLYTYTHSINVCVYFSALAREYFMIRDHFLTNDFQITKIPLTKELCRSYALGAMLHDIGKLDIPLEIMNKAEPLSPDEYETVKMHPVNGFNRLVEAGVNDKTILDSVLQHHMRLTGDGYPKPHNGSYNPIVQMISICDTFDAIRSERVYDGAKDFRFAIKEIKLDYDKKYYEKPIFASFLNIFNKKHFQKDM